MTQLSHLTVMLVICFISLSMQVHHHIVLFKHPYFEGAPEKVLEYSKYQCKTFDEPIHVSAVKVHGGCVILYSNILCKGISLKVPFDAPFVVFNTSSVRYC